MIRSVVFDIGETLLDDTREWARWAQWLGVPAHTFSALMGAVVCRGGQLVETFALLRPGFDLAYERGLREAAGVGELIEERDLYPDVRASLGALRAAGLWVGVAGNQTARAGALVRELDLPVDAVATSGEWGVSKPDSQFFARVVDWAPGRPEEILYVGDHRDHDIVPASAVGLRAALIRRGPWGHLWADDPLVTGHAEWVIDSLEELPALLHG